MPDTPPLLTVTLNPAIDQTLSIPGFAAGRVNRVADAQSHPGGKGVNVATMLADLGAAVGVTGWLGARNAEPFQLLFSKKRVTDAFLRVPGETRTSIKIVDETSGQTTDVNFPGLRMPPTATADLVRHLEALVVPGAWLVLAGSVPPGVADDVYATLAATVRSRGGRVVLDTSGPPLRAALDAAAAGGGLGGGLDAGLDAGLDVVKPNGAELAELVGRPLTTPGDVLAAAREAIVARGVPLAAVSLGGDGALFVTADRAVRTRAPVVPVRSTVGAGDAMVAGLVFALSRGRSLDEAAILATALGTHAVTRVGSGLDDGGHLALQGQIRVEDVRG